MIEFFELPTHGDRARDELDIPEWFVNFRIDYAWVNDDETTTIDDSDPLVTVEKSYVHEGERCYEIQNYRVEDWKVTTRRGDVRVLVYFDLETLREAERNAKLLLQRQASGELGEYADPTYQTAGDLLDVGVVFKGFARHSYFAELAQAFSMGQLFDDIEEIAEEIEEILRDVQRLRDLNGTVLATHEDVVWRRKAERVLSFSSIDIVEVECEEWILEQPEGRAVQKAAFEEQIYPPPKMREELARTVGAFDGVVEPEECDEAAQKLVRELVDRYSPASEER